MGRLPHHMESLKVGNTASPPLSITTIAVNSLICKCEDLIAKLQTVFDWATASAGVVTGAGESGVKATGLLELESRFGQGAHASAQAARAHYVEQTRDRLASFGMALKGGDEALESHWDGRHGPALWA